MSQPSSEITPFWLTVRLLLRAARQRTHGAAKRQQELLRQRTGKKARSSVGSPTTMTFLAAFLAIAIQVMFAASLYSSLEIATRLEMAGHGQMVVSDHFFEDAFGDKGKKVDREKAVSDEAGRQKEHIGGTKEERAATFKRQLDLYGRAGFANETEMENNMRHLELAGPLFLAVGMLVLLWWFVVMVCQGEGGMAMDLQGRRHPMLEWLMSHPISPAAAFTGEMLAPLAANPFSVAAAPIIFIVILAPFYSFPLALLGGLLIGWPVALAASFAGKAIEINALLRLSPRSRSVVLAMKTWLGFAPIVMMPLLLMTQQNGFAWTVLSWLQPAAHWLAWPLLPWLAGVRADGSHSFMQGMLVSWLFAGGVIAVSLWLSARATNGSLQGPSEGRPSAPVVADLLGQVPFLRDPLFKKEILWFCRDRGAIVQAILIPLTLGAFQVFNMRFVTEHALDNWSYLCGAGIIFGTYFLLTLGPRSLLSEGPALWITLTWPRGLESLLKAKAKLWALMADLIVGAILVFAAMWFPADAWKIAVVAVGWVVFARSLSEKAVTLVPSITASGQPERVPAGRQWAAFLGTFSFATGVITQNWHLAALGVVFSCVTAAAMWQNFRARLPFLFDPWSEKLPPPPTLMHAMVAITAMIEGQALIFVFLAAIPMALQGQLSEGTHWVVQALAYGITAVLTWWFTRRFLSRAGVPSRQIWRWAESGLPQSPERETPAARFAKALALGVGGGLLLGVCALGYLLVMGQIPLFKDVILRNSSYLLEVPLIHYAYALIAIGMAPFAEEYLFRGLLFRALDREWGGWRAILGSALLFGVYHPPLSWLPVIAVGVWNAWLFKRTGSLWPCVLAHMAYNTVVVLAA